MLFNDVAAKAGPLIGAQNSGDAADNSSDDRAHWSGCTITFAGAAFNASWHALGGC
jgi:hypothetical protein